MSQYNGNDAYFEWKGVDMSGFFTDAFGFNPTNSGTDVTAGAGATDIQRNPGLNDTTLSVNLYYETDDALRATYLPLLKPGTKGIAIYAPEGLVAGKPVHEQEMIINGSGGPNIDITKAKVLFPITMDGADKPVRNIFDDVV